MDRSSFYDVVSRDCLRATVKEAGTPSFLYFRRMVERRIADVRRCLPACFEVHYAVKANPNAALLRLLSGQGLGADVASAGELRAALDAGIPVQRMQFTGPGKTRPELELAITAGVSAINVESLRELEHVCALAHALGLTANIGLRVTPVRSHAGAGMRMGSGTQFGVPEEDVPAAIDLIRGRPAELRFTGIHVHAGSQILAAGTFGDHFRTVLDIAARVDEMTDHRVDRVNFGGGWGIRYYRGQTDLDLDEVERQVASAVREPRFARLAAEAQLIVEPGRFLVGESGVYAVEVLYCKRVQGKRLVIVDGGLHHHYLLAGGMGQVIRRNFETDAFIDIKRMRDTPVPHTVAGCLCTPQDLLAVDCGYPGELAEGDHIVFFNSGAYGPSASPAGFLSHAPANEVLL